MTGNSIDVTLQDVTALAEGGSILSFGLYNLDGASATLRGGSFTARRGGVTYGIISDGTDTTLEATNVTVLSESYSLYLQNGTVRLGVTQLGGGAFRNSGTLICFQVYDGSFNPYTCP